MIIDHPLLGPRDSAEFVYLGDAAMIDRPDPETATPQDWHDYAYLRDNPAGVTRDMWYHEGGCGAWIIVTRDTVTHEVLDTALATDAKGVLA